MTASTTAAILDPSRFLGAAFYAIVVILIAWLIGKILHVAVHRYLDKAEAAGTDSTSIRFLGELARVAVYIIAFLCYANIVPALHSVGTAWLASVGVISIIIGLATQSTLSNVVAGIALILYRPFRIGDRIQVTTPTGNEIGLVEDIGLGYTRLRTADGRRIVLPNSIISSQTNINFSHNRSHVLLEISLTVENGSDIDVARTIILESAKKIAKITKVNGCFVTSLTSAGTVVMLSAMCTDPGDIASIKSELLEDAKKGFDSKGIKIG